MKKMQENFTTPEQSKRLLELGLPADSADCYYGALGFGNRYHKYPSICCCDGFSGNIDIPCWSVGRLIEIIMLCGTSANHKLRPILDSDLYETYYTLIEYLVQELEENAEDWYDFTKLED